jgi:OOP family OmpA-OmpF porin
MNNKFYKAALGLMLALGASAAFAQEAPPEMRPYLTADYIGVFHDGSRNSLNGMGGGLSYGTALAKHWGLETSLFYNSYGTNSTHRADWNEYGAKVDGMFFYQRKRAFSPYFGLGVGGIRSNERTSGQHSTDPFVDVGLGYFTYFGIGSMDLGVRADARYRWMDTKGIGGVGSLAEPVLKVSLVLPLGPRPVAAAPVFIPAKAAEPVREPEHARAPAPARLDSDGDGVFDDQDQCPRTPTGTQVDERGCPVVDEKARFFDAVHFNFNDSDLTKVSKTTLDKAAAEIKDMAEKGPVKVEVDGHTDSVGSDGYNQALSERRAKIVTKYLTQKGVNGKTISSNAYGKSMPAKSNDTDAGRAYNRRAEVKAIEQ